MKSISVALSSILRAKIKNKIKNYETRMSKINVWNYMINIIEDAKIKSEIQRILSDTRLVNLR